MLAVKIIAIVLVALFSFGCDKPKQPEPKEIKSSKTVEDLSGITAVKQGEYIKSKIKEFEKTEEERFKEAENKE